MFLIYICLFLFLIILINSFLYSFGYLDEVEDFLNSKIKDDEDR